MESPPKLPAEIHLVFSTASSEFTLMLDFLRRSSVVALDAEWKPVRRQRGDVPATEKSSALSSSLTDFPTVAVLQIACRCGCEMRDLSRTTEVRVFVVDLLAVPAVAIWEPLREVFVSPDVIKLGFRLKQDLIFLSSTFASQGCHPGFSEVVPFLDITSIYYHLQTKQSVKKIPKETKSLATICKEVLDITLSKELQCSDWSCRPLTKEQILYAAADAYYLLEIFDVFISNIICEGSIYAPNINRGLKEIFEKPNSCDNILQIKFCQAPDMVKSSGLEILSLNTSSTAHWPSSKDVLPFDYSLTKVVKNYGEHILLKESERKPRISKKKGKRRPLFGSKVQIRNGINCDCEGPPPWDPSLGGDGCPKFLCDVMVEGLAKQLRCVGFDAAVPSSRKPEVRQLIDQAYKEKRVLLTRDAKLLRYHYLIPNQVYKIKSLPKNEQLLEVIDTFNLKVCEEQLMSRCTKCNGMFIQKPLSIEEAVEASKGFQIIPNCLFKKDLEFWQCMDCNQVYWEGTQYHSAVQKFINVCKLNE